MKLPFTSLTTKIVLLVIAMGVASVMVTLHATWRLQHIQAQYQALLQEQGRTAAKVGQVRQSLGEMSAVVHTVLTSSNDEQTLLHKAQLTQVQQEFAQTIEALRPWMLGHEHVLDTALTQAEHTFEAGYMVIDASLSWRADRALLALSHSFTPALKQLHAEVNTVWQSSLAVFQQSSADLASTTQSTLTQTRWLHGVIVLLVAAGAGAIALLHMSRPIERLTRSMQRMREQHYDTPIADQDRRDEIGTMARTLQSFGAALQEAKRLEQAILAHQQQDLLVEQLQQLTRALPGTVFQMQLQPGMSLKLCFVSPQWVQLMGLPADTDSSVEYAAQRIRYHDATVTRLSEQHYMESARTLQPVDFDIAMQMADGVTRWIKSRASPHMQADGTVTFNGVWLDVTKERTQAQALEKAKRQAEQIAHEKSMLQASISHEIRTPLNAILGLTQLMLKADMPQTQREQLRNVLRASQHLRGIVNEVLDFSKIDAGQLKLENTDFSLESVVLDVLSMCNEEAAKKGLSMNYKMAREVPDSLRGDPHRIAQILLNYVNNAIKFTTAGDIHIALRLDERSTLHRIVLHVSVTDTGPGIPADRIPLLFQAFQQADNSITRRFGGTGLGLTISRALAQLMGGAAGVESALGQGSTFWFTAVLEPARKPVLRDQSLAQPSTPTAEAWQGMRLLVVDDNPLNRAVAEGMLHALGLHTEIAEDGAQALLKLQAVGPDYFQCVLMDVQMPHMDGISATKALRQLAGFEKLPVIAMTAHTGVHDVERTLQAGMNAHLSKPLLESALHQILHEWLGRGIADPSCAQAPVDVPESLPIEFDGSCIDALAQLFDRAKLMQLVEQFSHDSLQRAQQLPTLAQSNNWPAMRMEAHKLTGTAATFGLLRLGHLSSQLSAALKSEDAAWVMQLAHSVTDSATEGIAQLRAYCLASSKRS